MLAILLNTNPDEWLSRGDVFSRPAIPGEVEWYGVGFGGREAGAMGLSPTCFRNEKWNIIQLVGDPSDL